MAPVDTNAQAESRTGRSVRRCVGIASGTFLAVLVSLGAAIVIVPLWRDTLPNGYRVFRPGGPPVIVDASDSLVIEGVVALRTKDSLVLTAVCDPAAPLTSMPVTVGFVALETRSGEIWRSESKEELSGMLEREGYRAIGPAFDALQRR